MDNIENNNASTQKLNTKLLTSFGIIIVVIVVGFLLLRGTTPPPAKKPAININENTPTAQNIIRPVSEKDHVLGNPNASIVIVEYSDTECPFCKRFQSVMQKIVSEYDGQVAWVYRHFPIASLHQKAFKESMAMECANEQGGNNMFWLYTNEIYSRTNSNDSLDPEELYKIATDLKLNTAKFKKCLDSNKYANVIEADLADGSNAGVQGTPTSFILKDGNMVQMVPGAVQYEQLSSLIEGLLQ